MIIVHSYVRRVIWDIINDRTLELLGSILVRRYVTNKTVYNFRSHFDKSYVTVQGLDTWFIFESFWIRTSTIFTRFSSLPVEDRIAYSYYVYVFLLLCTLYSVYSVFIVPTGILRLPWLRFFRAFSSVVRQMPGYNSQRQGTARTLSNWLIVLFYVLYSSQLVNWVVLRIVCVDCVVLCIDCV